MLSRAKPLLLASPCCSRCISLSAVKFLDTGTGKKRKPWDKRFRVNAKDIGPSKEGGSKEMVKILAERIVAPTGIVDKQTKRFIPVPEMVPEFVVPDLTDFPLKPYVTYTAKNITQKELTSRDVFNSVYASGIEDDVRSGKIQVRDGKVHLEDGRVLDFETGQVAT